jgi:hypothetical protein
VSTGHPKTAAPDGATVVEQLAALDIEQRERHRALGEAVVARWHGLVLAAIADIDATAILPRRRTHRSLNKGTPAHD